MIKNSKTQGTVLVTGAAKRIGAAICQSLSLLGYTIAIHYNHSFEEAKKLSDDIQSQGGDSQLYQCDLSNEQQTKNLIGEIYKTHSDLNVLINNASIFEPSTIKDSNSESMHRHFNTNFHAPYLLTSEFAKVCQKGHIINILDTHITNNKTTHAAYLLSKKALYELTKISSVELAPNIRVNAVAPGLILMPEGQGDEYLEKRKESIPQKIQGKPQQISSIIEFLLNSNYITGEVIFNDGGEHLN